MRTARTHSRSSLFLMELILAILFFSIASAVCVQLFARAHTASIQSRDLNRAVLAAQSAAEIVRSADGLDEIARLAGAVDGDSRQPGVLSAWYDAGWTPCGERDASYRMQIVLREGDDPGGVVEAEITVARLSPASGPEELFRLDARRYQPAA